MRTMFMRVGAGLAVAALAAGAPVQAATPCWAGKEVAAARVHQMQTMLMVAALRCRAAKIDIVADYDGFVVAQGDAIAAANLVIKQHFAAAGGTQADYDHFATSLANSFGDEETSQASCADAAAIAHEAAAASAGGALDRVASARLFPAMLPGGACEAGETLAVVAPTAKPDAALPPIVMAAAPPAASEPVTLPADVTAALTVLARLQAPVAPASASPMQIAAAAH